MNLTTEVDIPSQNASELGGKRVLFTEGNNRSVKGRVDDACDLRDQRPELSRLYANDITGAFPSEIEAFFRALGISKVEYAAVGILAESIFVAGPRAAEVEDFAHLGRDQVDRARRDALPLQ